VSQSSEVPHARSSLQPFPFLSRQVAHPAAASGMLKYEANAPHVRPHRVSQLEARHALSLETIAALSAGTERSIVHLDRHAGSPLQAPMQLS
jgi:hypothetical protein